MVMQEDPLPGTLVYVCNGIYRGYVGRIDRYTASMVWLRFLEDHHRQPVDDAQGLIARHNFHRLLARHSRADPYPELRRRAPASRRRGGAHPLRRAVVDLVVAHASESADFDAEINAVLADLNARLLARSSPH
jgi:hypothetical protein